MPKKANSDIAVRSIGGVEMRIDRTPHVAIEVERLDAEVLSDKKIAFTQAAAEKYIDLPIFPGERAVTESHVQHLVDEMNRGLFNQLLVILSTAELDGVTYKINGQHTAWARMFMPADYEMTVREIRYKVQTPEQLRLLYATYDRLMQRNDAHVTKIHLVGLPEVGDLPPSLIQRLIPGFKLWQFEDAKERARQSPEQIAALIRHEYARVFRRVAKFMQDHDDVHLKRAAVWAAMFASCERDQKGELAAQFWTPVADGLGIESKTDPRYALRELLVNMRIKSAAGGTPARIMESEDAYRICLLAWNKWRTGEAVRSAMRAPKERPKLK